MDSLNLERLRLEGGGGGTLPVDRISNLPEAIISHILSLLPTKSAFVTSFLSKDWQLRWTKTTAFDFDDQLWPDGEMNFVEFVNMVLLMSNTEPVHKLHLRWLCDDLQPNFISIWLRTAIARNLRDLALAATTPDGSTAVQHSEDDHVFKLPAALYSCATLENLRLEGPFLVELPKSVRLPKLSLLELHMVKFDCDESVERLISSCPVLHSLRIVRLHHHRLLVYKIFSPSLKRFQMWLHKCCHICAASDTKLVINTPALEHLLLDGVPFSGITCVQQVMPVNALTIRAARDSSFPQGGGVAGLIQACSGVDGLILGEQEMLALGRVTATFGSLTKLVADFTRSHWSNLLDFIDRCISLQVLNIKVSDMRDVIEAEGVLESLGGSYWRHPTRVPGCLSASLKYVYFREFKGTEDELAMLKFLLDHGSLIERVHLSSRQRNRVVSHEQRLYILQKASMLSRSSAACRISFS